MRRVPGDNVCMEKQSLGRGAADSFWPLRVYRLPWLQRLPCCPYQTSPVASVYSRRGRRIARPPPGSHQGQSDVNARAVCTHARTRRVRPAHPGGGACGLGSAPERPAPPPGPASSPPGTARSRELAAEPGWERLGALRRGWAWGRWPQERLPRGRGGDAARGRK